MTAVSKNTDALIKIVQDTLLQLQRLVDQSQVPQSDLLSVVKSYLLDVVAATINLAEASYPGSAPLLYTEMEVAMKASALREMADFSANHGSSLYSAATIAENDTTGGMNYIAQQLAIALFKSLAELPKPMREQDMMLRAIGTLLVNLLNQHFTHTAHQVLDRLCAHVHLVLNDLTAKTMH